MPYGHHHNNALTSIANQVCFDVIGLDGLLNSKFRGDYFMAAKRGALNSRPK